MLIRFGGYEKWAYLVFHVHLCYLCTENETTAPLYGVTLNPLDSDVVSYISLRLSHFWCEVFFFSLSGC